MPDSAACLVERAAQAMREAYTQHADGRKPIPWEQADEDKKAVWRVCAKAAQQVFCG